MFIIVMNTGMVVALLCIFISALSSFLSIVFNKTVALFTARFTHVLVAIMWSVALVISSTLTMLAQIVSIYWPGNFLYGFDVSTTVGQVGLALTQAFVFLLLFSSLLLYLAIFFKVRVSSRRVNAANNVQQRTVKEKKTAARLFCICMTFCITYMPYAICLGANPTFLATIRKDIFIATLYWFMIMLVLYPLLHGLLFTQIKEAFYSIILKKSCG